MQSLKLLLIRHGETEANAARIVQGQRPGLLSEKGRRQAVQAGVVLQEESIDTMYSSNLERALETARILTANRPTIVLEDARLREQNFGVYEGKPLISLLKDMKLEKKDFTTFDPQGGEESGDFRHRVSGFLEEIIERHSGQTVVLVTHNGVIGLLLNELSSNRFCQTPVENCIIITLRILRINCSRRTIATTDSTEKESTLIV